MFQLDSENPQETLQIGEAIGNLLLPGDLVNINGTLGAGKTLLIKGICTSLRIPTDQVTSPTFSIINEYYGEYTVYHFDLYRLDSGTELEGIGYEEFFYGNGIALVEWGNLFDEYLPKERLDIELRVVNEDARQLSLIGSGERHKQLAQELKEELGCTS